jgi:NADPH-dependent glutamate synthase beta subunit-like oxidoreductase
MICVVKVEGKKNLVPSCATIAEEGMIVTNDDPEIAAARKSALELLLSDHAGDCMGPCEVACPAGMDIPEMLRHMAAGRYKDAIATIKADIALPAVTGYICPAPCEKVCRRGQVDEAISIRLVKRCAAELDLAKCAV